MQNYTCLKRRILDLKRKKGLPERIGYGDQTVIEENCVEDKEDTYQVTRSKVLGLYSARPFPPVHNMEYHEINYVPINHNLTNIIDPDNMHDVWKKNDENDRYFEYDKEDPAIEFEKGYLKVYPIDVKPVVWNRREKDRWGALHKRLKNVPKMKHHIRNRKDIQAARLLTDVIIDILIDLNKKGELYTGESGLYHNLTFNSNLKKVQKVLREDFGVEIDMPNLRNYMDKVKAWRPPKKTEFDIWRDYKWNNILFGWSNKSSENTLFYAAVFEMIEALDSD